MYNKVGMLNIYIMAITENTFTKTNMNHMV